MVSQKFSSFSRRVLPDPVHFYQLWGSCLLETDGEANIHNTHKCRVVKLIAVQIVSQHYVGTKLNWTKLCMIVIAGCTFNLSPSTHTHEARMGDHKVNTGFEKCLSESSHLHKHSDPLLWQPLSNWAQVHPECVNHFKAIDSHMDLLWWMLLCQEVMHKGATHSCMKLELWMVDKQLQGQYFLFSMCVWSCP